MIHRLLAIFAVTALLSTSSREADAQFGGSSSGGRGMSSGGMGGGGGSFSGGMGGMSGGSGGFGSSMGGMGGGMGGFGNSMGGGFGGGMGGNSGFGGGQSAFGNSGFGGNSRSGMGGGQSNFVGRDANDMSATFGQMGGKAGQQFFNNMNRSMKNNNRRSNKSQQTAQAAGQPMRVDVKVAFAVPRPTPNQSAAEIRTRLSKILVANKMVMPTVKMEGDTVVLTGSAANESQRAVISQLLALEPGIRTVRNEMTIAQPAGAPSGIAPAPGS